MIDPIDDKTSSLPFADTGAAFPAAPSPTVEPHTALSAVPASTITPPDEAKLLEFDLVRIRGPVYAWDKKKAEERTANAVRVAKHREKLAAEGLRQTAVPVSLLDEVKAAGGWQQWEAKKSAATAPVVPTTPEKIVERVEVPIKLGNRDTESLSVGRRVQALTGWKAAMMKWLLKP